MKLLIYGNRKQDDEIYDISTPEKEVAAYAIIFKSLDGYWEVYEDLKESSEPQVVCEPCQKDIHRLCEDPEECACTEVECPASKWRRKNKNLRWKKLYQEANKGNFKSMKQLMDERSNAGYEYEEFKFAEVKNPLEHKEDEDDD